MVWLCKLRPGEVQRGKESTEGLREASRLAPDSIACVILAGLQGFSGPSSSAVGVRVATLDDLKALYLKLSLLFLSLQLSMSTTV